MQSIVHSIDVRLKLEGKTWNETALFMKYQYQPQEDLEAGFRQIGQLLANRYDTTVQCKLPGTDYRDIFEPADDNTNPTRQALRSLRPGLPKLFELGEVRATPMVKELCAQYDVDPMNFVERHVSGDFGDYATENLRLERDNQRAVEYGGRVYSSYSFCNRGPVTVITEPDRSATSLVYGPEYDLTSIAMPLGKPYGLVQFRVKAEGKTWDETPYGESYFGTTVSREEALKRMERIGQTLANQYKTEVRLNLLYQDEGYFFTPKEPEPLTVKKMLRREAPVRKFALGEVGMTWAALELCQSQHLAAARLLERHVSGDFGNLDETEKEANAQAIEQNGRVSSRYLVGDGIVLVVTQEDRSSTIVLLPGEDENTSEFITRRGAKAQGIHDIPAAAARGADEAARREGRQPEPLLRETPLTASYLTLLAAMKRENGQFGMSQPQIKTEEQAYYDACKLLSASLSDLSGEKYRFELKAGDFLLERGVLTLAASEGGEQAVIGVITLEEQEPTLPELWLRHLRTKRGLAGEAIVPISLDFEFCTAALWAIWGAIRAIAPSVQKIELTSGTSLLTSTEPRNCRVTTHLG